MDLDPVAQLSVGDSTACVVTESGRVRCWVAGRYALLTEPPPDDLERVRQVELGTAHACALTVSGRVRCWGLNGDGQASPPGDLGPVAQIAVGDTHTCALTVSGRVRCWGNNLRGQLSPPGDLGEVTQVQVSERYSCARTVSGQLRCWGDPITALSLVPGLVIDAFVLCVSLAEGSVHCPGGARLHGMRPEPSPGEVTMAVWPRQLRTGERAAIRFVDLRQTAAAFTARIEVLSEGTADIGSHYRLLDSNGRPLSAEPDGSYLLRVDPNSPQPAENPPMAWLEALAAGRGSRLYVRPIELLPASGSAPSIRLFTQPVELGEGPFLSASTDTLTEGAEEAQLSILLPLTHAGLQVELELAVGGTVLAGADYTLVAADPQQGIVLSGEATDEITLRVDSAPTEALRLRLLPRADDRISQGERLLNLRLSRYRVVSDSSRTVTLPPALDLTILDDELPTVQQVQLGLNTDFACVLLDGGLVRCAGADDFGRATPPDDLGLVTQLSVGGEHSCALTAEGRVRCWGSDDSGQSTPPEGLGAVAQLGVGESHSCALTVAGGVRCWGNDADRRTTPPDNLGAVAQLVVGGTHNCALTMVGRARCWGNDDSGQSTLPEGLGPVAQVALGESHSCALTVGGEVRCWGINADGSGDGRATPPVGLRPVVQIALGESHSCALAVSGRLRCWGDNTDGRSSPPNNLAPFEQLTAGESHGCARTIAGQLRCWGAVVDVSSLPPDSVTAIDASGFCALLAEGSVYCPGRSQLVPPELRPGDVVMSVWPRRLGTGQRAAIRFADLRETTAAFTARIEVFADGSAESDRDYRLLDGNGQPLSAESALVAGNSVAWIEALDGGQGLPLSLYVRPLELLPASGSTPSIRPVIQSIELVAEVLGSLTVAGPAAMQQQNRPGDEVLFDVRVTAVGSKGTAPWQPTEALRLQYTASAPAVRVAYDSALTFSGGVATVTVSVTPSPGTDAAVIFHVAGGPGDLAGVVANLVTVDVRVADALSTVTLTVQNGLMRTVESGQEEAVIAVQLMTAYLIANQPEQTRLLLRAVATNGAEVSAPVAVVVPAGGAATANLSLMLGDARQTTVSFEVVGLPSEVSLVSPEVRVELVPVPASLEVSVTPAASEALAPRGEAVVEFRVRVEVRGSDGQLFGGLNDLVLGTAVTDVADGVAGDLVFSSAALEETATGVYENTVMATITTDQVSAARVEFTAAGAGLSSVSVTVQLARQVAVDNLWLWLTDSFILQTAPGAAARIGVNVRVLDQFQRRFSPTGLRLRVVDTADETEVLVMTPALVFDAQGEARFRLELVPPGVDLHLRVEVIGVTDLGVTANTAALTVVALEFLGSLTMTGPSSTPTQTMPAEPVVFDVRIVAVGTKASPRWQPHPALLLELQHTAGPGVIVDYDSILDFRGGSAIVAVSVTPDPGTDAVVTFSFAGAPGALDGVVRNMLTVTVDTVAVLMAVTLTVPGERLRTVGSGQEEVLFTVELMTESIGGIEPQQRELELRALATNGVEVLGDGVVVVSSGSGTVELSLMLGDARQTKVSFEVLDLPNGVIITSQEVRIELVPVPVSLALSATPQAILELEPRGEAAAEFRVRAEVPGSDGQPFGGLSDLLLGIRVTDVVAGVAGDINLSFAPLVEAAAGVYESIVMVAIAADQVSMASIEVTVVDSGKSGVAGVPVTVQLARRAALDSLTLSLSDVVLAQPGPGASVQTMATVMASDQFDRPFMPTGLRLRVVDTAAETEVLVTTPALVFDARGEAQSVLSLIPSLGTDQTLRVEVIGATDLGVIANATTLTLIPFEVLGVLTVTGPSSSPTQTMPAEVVVFELRVVAEGSEGTQPWQPTELLELQHTARPGVMVDYDSTLNFSAGVATVTVSVTPDPGTDALVIFSVTGAPADLAGVAINPAELSVGAVEVLSTVTLTVPGELMRTVGSGQEVLLITVELMTESFGGNEGQQRELVLRAVATNGVEASADVVAVIGNGSGTAELSLMLGDAIQTTVSFEVVGLPSGVSIISPELTVELVVVPASLALSALPQAILELEPRRELSVEFRVRAAVQGSDGQPFGGLNDLVLGTTVADGVVDGDKDDLVFSATALEETATGVYESTVRVTIAAGRVSAASVQLSVAVDGAGSGTAVVQLARPVVVDRLELSLSDVVLEQLAPRASVQTTATVSVRNQFGDSFMPAGLRLRVVDAAAETEVLVTTPALVFDARGEAQVVLELTPLGTDRELRVEVIGVTALGVTGNTTTLTLVVLEVLGSLTVAGPAVSQQQTVPDDPVRFDVSITAVGSKGTEPWQPTEALRLQYTASAPGVTVVYDSALSFSAGVATVAVSVTPSPGTDAVVTFSVVGGPGELADVVANMVANMLTVDVGVAEVLSTVTLTVQNGLMRTVRSGQEEALIAVQLMTEYSIENEPEQTPLRLRAVATNGVEVSGPVDVIVPAGGATTATLSLMLGTARQTKVSFEVVGLPSGASLNSPEVRVELVPVPVSLVLSATPLLSEELEPRRELAVEFGVRVEIQGSDGQPLGGLNDLVLNTTVTEVVAGEPGDLAFLSAALEESTAGVYESTVMVTVAAGRVSMASIEITVAGGGTSDLADEPVTVRLARQVILDSLMLSLAETSLEQSAPGESVQTMATVVARDQFQRPFSPTGLRLRAVDIDDGSLVLVLLQELVFDTGGEAQSVLSLTPPRGTNQDLRVELSGVTDAEVSIATVDLRIDAAEAVDRVILTVVSGSRQFVTTATFSITLELSLAPAGNRPLTAATALTVQLQVSVVGGATLLGPSQFPVSVSGETPSSVEIEAMFTGNAVSTTISLSIVGGVPAESSAVILPENTVAVRLVGALDVDGDAVFDIRDALLILMAGNMSLPDSIPPNVRAQLSELLNPANQDLRLDVNDNDLVEPIDVRVLLRYLAGLRGDSLMGNTVDAEAIERRAREIIEPSR